MSSLRVVRHGEPTKAPVSARVALINMPFGMADGPSIQCGVLKGALLGVGHEVDVYYLNLELAAELGARLYEEFAHLPKDLVLGDWLFSAAAFGRRSDELAYRDSLPYLEELCKQLNVSFERLCEFRNEFFPAWIDRWCAEVDWDAYLAVGFTTTFEQSTASFGLARAIKEKHPDVLTIFGGASFDDEMGKEFVRGLPFIDYAVSGEGDRALPEMITSIAQGESPLGIPGVVGKSDGKLVENGPAPLVENLDTLPDPNYDEYFETLFRLGRERILGRKPPLLIFESARGCWWAEKCHCTYCGLNKGGIKFRSKSPTEVMAQLRRLSAKYKIIYFTAVDNIMDHRYLEEIYKPLAEKRYDYRIFCEVKSNLKPSQLRTMARGGVVVIQPGIESLNSHILSLMRKGVTMLQNVRLMKWACYYGIDVHWSILTGFPGETAEDYEEQLRLVPLLRHLSPPKGVVRIWLERFSPYFTDRSFPVKDIRPLRAYRFVFPEEELDLQKIAYFFHYKMESTLPSEHHDELRELVDSWKSAWRRKPHPELVYQRAHDWIQVIDRRTEEMAAYAFEGWEASAYEFCGETDRSLASICRYLARTEEAAFSEEEVRASLEKFCARGLMLEEKNRFLSLALPVNANW